METTSYPIYKLLHTGNSFTVKPNNNIAIILSDGASANWEAENGTTGKVSVNMVLGSYIQEITITAVAGDIELILNGDVQLATPDSLKEVKNSQGNLNVSLEDFSVVMRNVLSQTLLRTTNNLTYTSSLGNAQRVILTNTSGVVAGDVIANIPQLGGFAVKDALFNPTDKILWQQSVRSKIS